MAFKSVTISFSYHLGSNKLQAIKTSLILIVLNQAPYLECDVIVHCIHDIWQYNS